VDSERELRSLTRLRSCPYLSSSRRVRETGRQLLAALDRQSVLESLQEGLHNLAVDLGQVVAAGPLDDEAARLCGERYVHER